MRSALRRAALSAALLSAAPGCFQHYGPGYEESGYLRSGLCAPFCYRSDYSTHRKVVREGDLVEGALPGSSAPYAGWTITRIMAGGVELAPRPDSWERVVIPYGRQESIQSPVQRPNETFLGSLLFERGDAPGTAVMSVIERVR